MCDLCPCTKKWGESKSTEESLPLVHGVGRGHRNSPFCAFSPMEKSHCEFTTWIWLWVWKSLQITSGCLHASLSSIYVLSLGSRAAPHPDPAELQLCCCIMCLQTVQRCEMTTRVNLHRTSMIFPLWKSFLCQKSAKYAAVLQIAGVVPDASVISVQWERGETSIREGHCTPAVMLTPDTLGSIGQKDARRFALRLYLITCIAHSLVWFNDLYFLSGIGHVCLDAPKILGRCKAKIKCHSPPIALGERNKLPICLLLPWAMFMGA